MRKRKSVRKAEKTSGCCGTHVKAFETPLSKCLLLDPFPPSGACHDVDPFGVYYTEDGGAVAFMQALRCSPRYVKCDAPEDVDAIITRVFLAAASHSHRHISVKKDTLSSVLRLANDAGRSGRLFMHPECVVTKRPDWTPLVTLPKNVILCVDFCHPEELGRLMYSCGTYGVSLCRPDKVRSIEVVPDPPVTLGLDTRKLLA